MSFVGTAVAGAIQAPLSGKTSEKSVARICDAIGKKEAKRWHRRDFLCRGSGENRQRLDLLSAGPKFHFDEYARLITAGGGSVNTLESGVESLNRSHQSATLNHLEGRSRVSGSRYVTGMLGSPSQV